MSQLCRALGAVFLVEMLVDAKTAWHIEAAVAGT